MLDVRILADVAVSPNLAAGEASVCCAYALTGSLSDGRLATVFRRGTTKHSHDGALVMQASGDGGASWNKPVTVYDGGTDVPRRTVVTGGLTETPSGQLLAVFGTVEGLAPNVYIFSPEGKALTRRILTARSTDGGNTWMPPTGLDVPGRSNTGITSPPFLSPLGDVCQLIEYRTEQGAQGTAIVRSGDDGRTFSAPTTVAADPAGELSLCDGRATVLPDGRILVVLWTFRRDGEETLSIHTTWSADDGDTWTPPAPIGLVGQVTAPLALSSGGVLAASNVRTPPEGIHLWYSSDGGGRWDTEQRILMWDERETRIAAAPVPAGSAAASGDDVWEALQGFTFGTPALVSAQDDSLVLTYYATLNGVIHIRACRFSLTISRNPQS